MKRNWMMTLSLVGAFGLSGICLAQEASKNEEKKDEKKAEVTVKTSGKLIMVGPDGKVTEKTFGDGQIVEGKKIDVKVTDGKDGEEQEIVLVTPDGEKKVIIMKKVDLKLDKKDGDKKESDGKKTIRLEAKVVGDGHGEHKTFVITGDGKTLDVKGAGIDVEKLKKLIEEKKGDLKPEDIQAFFKTVEGKPVGGAMKLKLDKVEGQHHMVLDGHPHVVVGGKTTASASASSSDVSGKLDKILDRLEKLEERLSKLEKKD
jgi:hypothetical protein